MFIVFTEFQVITTSWHSTIERAGIRWVGNANELNAGYAADGYARIKHISALLTVSRVGEMSAVNAIASAYTEKVPIVHVVGVPSTDSQRFQFNLHHSLGYGNFDTFAQIYDHFTCFQARLNSEYLACAMQLIDETLRQSWLQSRLVYISLPADLVKAKVSAKFLTSSIDLSISNTLYMAWALSIVKYIHTYSSGTYIAQAGYHRRRIYITISNERKGRRTVSQIRLSYVHNAVREENH